jgi:hypothetical protein
LLVRLGLWARAGRKCFQNPDLRRSWVVVGKMLQAHANQPNLGGRTF